MKMFSQQYFESQNDFYNTEYTTSWSSAPVIGAQILVLVMNYSFKAFTMPFGETITPSFNGITLVNRDTMLLL